MSGRLFSISKARTSAHSILARSQGKRSLSTKCFQMCPRSQYQISVTFYCVRRSMAEPLRHKQSSISRPISHSFRHTAHGSKSGSSWGHPSAIPGKEKNKEKNSTDPPNGKCDSGRFPLNPPRAHRSALLSLSLQFRRIGKRSIMFESARVTQSSSSATTN